MLTSLRGTLFKDISLANYTSWRVGGPADRLYKPADLEDCINFLKTLSNDEPLTWLGLGSNVLIRDAGIRGTVLITQGCLNALNQIDEVTVRAEAGVSCPVLARFTARLGLEGAEFLAGIPGTIGAALRMNAGCHQSETWDIVSSVEIVNRYTEKKIRYPKDYCIGYRHVDTYPDEWFIAGIFKLHLGKREQALKKIRSLLDHRTATQPTHDPSCGSVFRNPPGDYAARLIEACGLKGKTIGGASVSHKHANFIINDGTATAADIESLIQLLSNEVQHKHHVVLIPEVHVLGESI